MASLKYDESSESESHYSTGASSQDDQRSLSSIESPYAESTEFKFSRSSPLSCLKMVSELSNSHLNDIPAELHLLIFSHLDPLDSTCLGLTNAHFYNIHNALNGTVPISTYRRGRTWEFHGKQKCHHCGTPKCELHMHLRNWMPKKYEYCAIRQIYGLKVKADAKREQCYRSNPLKPEKCGRHPVVKKVPLEV